MLTISINLYHILTSCILINVANAQNVTTTLADYQNINITQMVIEAKIVPEMVRRAPHQLCRVFYKQGEVRPGEYWEFNKTIYPPLVTWNAEPNATYFLYFGCVQRFVPREEYNSFKLWVAEPTPKPGAIHTYQLWAISNIPGNNTMRGKTLIHYEGPGPSRGPAADERFVFLIYKQPSRNVEITDAKGVNYGYYTIPALDNITHIEKKFHIGTLVAGNFFRLLSKKESFLSSSSSSTFFSSSSSSTFQPTT